MSRISKIIYLIFLAFTLTSLTIEAEETQGFICNFEIEKNTYINHFVDIWGQHNFIFYQNGKVTDDSIVYSKIAWATFGRYGLELETGRGKKFSMFDVVSRPIISNYGENVFTYCL